MKKYMKISQLLPVLFGFFVMGFVDIVGISTSYVKKDFALSDTLSNLLPMMVFLWFAVFSIPTGILMGKLGRKETVLISGVITALAMIIPLVTYTFPFVLLAFALLGIGNTILQVSLNPLVADIVSKERLASTLTFGYFAKAVSSFLGPVLISMAVGLWGNWKYVFLIYAITTVISLLWLWKAPVKETNENETADNNNEKTAGLLKNKFLLCLFFIIVLSVGFEVGLMTVVPKYLQEKFLLSLEQGGIGCSMYFIARTLGTLAGSFLLVRLLPRRFLIYTSIGSVVSFIVLMISDTPWMFMTALFLMGLTFANIFSLVFAIALQAFPSQANGISALMITGVAGGALLPPLMGIVSDASQSQLPGFFILLAALLYILWSSACYIQKK